MKIAILTWNYPPKMVGGTEIATQNIARCLAKRGNEVLVITTRDPGLPKESMEEGFHVSRVGSFNFKLLKYIFFCLATLLILRKYKPNVIHAQAMWMGFPAFVAKIVLGKPYIIWGRGSDVYFPRLFKGFIIKLILRNADARIALTDDMKKKMQRICDRATFIIGNGIDMARFNIHSKEKVRHQLYIERDKKVIIFVGTLAVVKGVKYLIEAMNIMKIMNQENQQTTLLLVGDGEEKHSLESLAKRLQLGKSTSFIGRVNHERVSEYMFAADVFVLPSLSEGFPVVIPEAMAAGLPIVTTNVRGLPEIVKDGENGFTVEPQNPQQLAEKISLLLDDKELSQKISRNNRNKSKQYSWEVVAEKLEEVYLNAIGSHS